MRLGSFIRSGRVWSCRIGSCYCNALTIGRVTTIGIGGVKTPEVAKRKLTIADVRIGLVVVPPLPRETARAAVDARFELWEP